MGRAMAATLARAGLLAAVHNRTWERAEQLAHELDVPACRTAAELATASDVVLTVVADADAVAALYEGPDGLLAGLRPGTLCVEMSTIGPAPLARLATALAETGCTLVDAPVSGSIAMAEAGELTILAGGEAADVARAAPVLDALGRRTFHLGPLGAGATMKLAVNAAIYALNEGVAEALTLAERAGIPRERAYEALAESAVAAPFVHYRRAHFERPDEMPPQMRMELAAKDLALVEALAAEVGAPMPQALLNRQVMLDAMAAGLGSQDVTAVAAHLRDQATQGDT